MYPFHPDLVHIMAADSRHRIARHWPTSRRRRSTSPSGITSQSLPTPVAANPVITRRRVA